MYLVNESSKLESVNRVHEIGEKSHSLLDHPRIFDFIGYELILYLKLYSKIVFAFPDVAGLHSVELF